MTGDTIAGYVRKPLFERDRFWKRQFAAVPTMPQRLFDLIFGVLLPAICVFLDPIVFTAMFSVMRDECLLLMGLQATLLIVWLWVPALPRPARKLLAGVFLAGAGYALILGLAMLPYSFLGLVIVIGFLGFSPFPAFFVYLRNGVRAWRQRDSEELEAGHGVLIFLGLLVAILTPLLLARILSVPPIVPTGFDLLSLLGF